MTTVNDNELSQCVRKVLTQYFTDLDGEQASNLYDMVVQCVERPLLEVALDRCGSNQTRAADMLGINRNTLRKKMQALGIK